jgi:hypothetical protein
MRAVRLPNTTTSIEGRLMNGVSGPPYAIAPMIQTIDKAKPAAVMISMKVALNR